MPRGHINPITNLSYIVDQTPALQFPVPLSFTPGGRITILPRCTAFQWHCIGLDSP